MTDLRRMTVPAELDGVRADRAIAILEGLSRAASRQLIDTGDVVVAGTRVAPATKVHAGDQLEYPIPAPPLEVQAEPIEFAVAVEHEAFIVVNKPPGLIVHPGAGHPKGTLVNGLLDRYPELAALGAESRWGLVHRLDRDTSGLLVVARTREEYTHLQRELKERRVSRVYRALVAGHLKAATGTIDAPIGRDPVRPTRMAVVADGRPARTHYRRLADWAEVSLVEVTLETGRTHQIRVHFSSIGNAIVGDRTYGAHRAVPADPGRVWLHASELRFRTSAGSEVVVKADLPPDLAATLTMLGDPPSGLAHR